MVKKYGLENHILSLLGSVVVILIVITVYFLISGAKLASNPFEDMLSENMRL